MGRNKTTRRAAGAGLRAFARSRSGNVAMLWGLIGGVLIAMVGLTVDFTRAQMIRAQLQNAADGAALVAERSSNLSFAQREELARAFFDNEAGPYAAGAQFSIEELESGGHRANVSYVMPMTMAAIISDDDWTIAVTADAEASASPPIEVALVLDNTYSMNSDIGDLRDAATTLASFLLSIDGDTVSVALVPFEAYVNIGNGATQMAWMDTAGNAPYNGELLENRLLFRTNTSNGKSSGNCNHLPTTVTTNVGGTNYTSPYQIVWVKNGTRCEGRNPNTINYFDLYDQVPNISWKGCVEARPEPYDIQDDAPSAATPATMFVPLFSIDDGSGTSGVSNNWLQDNSIPGGVSSASGYQTRDGYRTLSVFKYAGYNANNLNEVSGNSARGPNRGCPSPIVPLTTNSTTILNAIGNMQVWLGGGTNSAEGLAWGWRVLSPGAPFTEGRPYNDPDDPVRKVIVLMTDGENTNIDQTSENSVLLSANNAYGYRGQWANFATDIETPPTSRRRPITSQSCPNNSWGAPCSYVQYVNGRQSLLCENIKATGIEIYTVAFRDPGDTIEQLLRDCATDDDHYFDAQNAQQLQAAFNAIGSGIGQLRITQ